MKMGFQLVMGILQKGWMVWFMDNVNNEKMDDDWGYAYFFGHLHIADVP